MFFEDHHRPGQEPKALTFLIEEPECFGVICQPESAIACLIRSFFEQAIKASEELGKVQDGFCIPDKFAADCDDCIQRAYMDAGQIFLCFAKRAPKRGNS